MEQAQESKTEMTNPPKDQKKMVAPQTKGQKMYKLLVLKPFMLGKVSYGEGGKVLKDTTFLTKVGEIVEVDRAKAKELCTKITGSFAFTGMRFNADRDVPRHDHTRARLATPADMVAKEAITPFDEDDVFAD